MQPGIGSSAGECLKLVLERGCYLIEARAIPLFWNSMNDIVAAVFQLPRAQLQFNSH
jgi:hypothetical protein